MLIATLVAVFDSERVFLPERSKEIRRITERKKEQLNE
jgi:hypothetical protein